MSSREEELNESSRTVKLLDSNTARSLCSGQVVVDLSSAVVQLLENALDANPTTITISFRLASETEFSSMEVTDDGTGILADDIPGVARRYWTSKLSSFEDLGSVKTYGFRGEALNSLCTVAKLEIITRSKVENPDVATSVTFSEDGEVLSMAPCPRNYGTSVIVSELFHKLPVRKKLLQKSLNKELSKAVRYAEAYGIVSSGTKIVLQKIVGKKMSILFRSLGVNMRENLINMYGIKQLDSLQYVNGQMSEIEGECIFIEGYVSSITEQAGSGRSSNDRQFSFINNRPVEAPKVLKCINSIYRSYSSRWALGSKHPIAILNFHMPPFSFDVNVSPDKRIVMIKDESVFIEKLKTFFENLFEPSLRHFEEVAYGSKQITDSRSGMSHNSSNTQRSRENHCSSNLVAGLSGPISSSESAPLAGFKKQVSIPAKLQTTLDDFGIKSTGTENLDGDHTRPVQSNIARQQQILLNSSEAARGSRSALEREERNPIVQNQLRFPLNPFVLSVTPSRVSIKESISVQSPEIISLEEDGLKFARLPRRSRLVGLERCAECAGDISPRSSVTTPKSMMKGDQFKQVSEEGKIEIISVDDEVEEHPPYNKMPHVDAPRPGKRKFPEKASQVLKIDFDTFSQKFLSRCSKDPLEHVNLSSPSACLQNNENSLGGNGSVAEEIEMKSTISKHNFQEMNVIGQFNRGFILAQFGDDLFIVDQHASDEKFKFEAYKNSFKIDFQPLVTPSKLDLPKHAISIIADNPDVFERNGFTFLFSSDQECYLTGVPSFKNYSFDENDIMYLVNSCIEDGSTTAMLPKVRIMLASKACRSAVMIGDSLSHLQMKKILSGMSTLEQPWNCPHGYIHYVCILVTQVYIFVDAQLCDMFSH